MRRAVIFSTRTAGFLSVLLVAAASAFAQQQPPQNGGWRKLGDQDSTPAAAPQDNPAPAYQNAPPAEQNPPQNYPPQQTGTLPSQLTLKPGTYVTVRINQPGIGIVGDNTVDLGTIIAPNPPSAGS